MLEEDKLRVGLISIQSSYEEKEKLYKDFEYFLNDLIGNEFWEFIRYYKNRNFLTKGILDSFFKAETEVQKGLLKEIKSFYRRQL